MMKPPMFYFVIALTAVLAAAFQEPVVDMGGKNVIGGRSYYLVPAVPGKGGGLGLAGRGDKKCPLEIVQESSEGNDGIPVKFSEWAGTHVGYVPEGHDLRIEMDIGDKICCQQTYWGLAGFDEKTMKIFVKAGPRKIGLTDTFELRKSGEGYRILWCSIIDLAGSTKLNSSGCEHIGIFVDDKGVRRFAFSDEPLVVKFKMFEMPPDSSSYKTI